MICIPNRSKRVLRSLGIVLTGIAFLALNGCSSLNLKDSFLGNLFSKKTFDYR